MGLRMWRGVAAALVLGAMAIFGALPSFAAGGDAADVLSALALLNDVRARDGLAPVTVDSQLSAAAQAHANYLVTNNGKPQLDGLNAHDEDLSLPGASKSGRDAGLASDIARGTPSVVDSVEGLLEAPLHQRWLLEPSLKQIGLGVSPYPLSGLVVVLDVAHGREGPSLISKPLVYPAPDQTGVPTRFFTETPDPRQATPAGAGGLTGPSITVNPTCGTLQAPSRVALHTLDGRDVPVWTINPGTKLTAVGGERSVSQIIVLPQRELETGTIYQVEIDTVCKGPAAATQHHLSWSFTTEGPRRAGVAGAGPSAPQPQPQQPQQPQQPTDAKQPAPQQAQQPADVKQPQPAQPPAQPIQPTPAPQPQPRPLTEPSQLRPLFVVDYVHGELADYVGGPLFASTYLANNGFGDGWGDPDPVVLEEGAWVLHFSSGVTLRARPGEAVAVIRPVADDQPE